VIDVLLWVLLIVGAVRGFFKGLIMAMFNLLSYLAGVVVAVKFSRYASVRLDQWAPGLHRWWPILGFFLVFACVILLVRRAGKGVQNIAEGLALGWVNRLGGVLFYCLLYVTLYSIAIYYGAKLHLFGTATLKESSTYPFLASLAERLIRMI